MIALFRRLLPLAKPRDLTFRELVPLFVASREKMGLRPYTLRNYDIWGRSILRGPLAELPVARFGAEDLVSLRHAHSLTYAEYMQVMLRWAHHQGLVVHDISHGQLSDRMHRDATPPRHLTPSEAQRFYSAVGDSYKAAFALGLYAGLRPLEICRIDWQAINVQEQRIRIDPEVSKVRRARVIEGLPTVLWAQLSLYSQREGPVLRRCIISHKWGEANSWLWVKERRRAARVACVSLAPDIIRHSFATYYVALTGSTDKAAKILGHCDLAMLATHYDGVATRADAEDYFHPKPILALPMPRPQSGAP